MLMAGMLLLGTLVAGGGGTALAGPAVENPQKVLSHFLCRQGKFRPPFTSAPTVELTDRFGTSSVTLNPPNLWCNPTRKVRGGKVTKVVDPRQHLKFYTFQSVPPGGVVNMLVTNQFGDSQPVQINEHPIALLVPTRVPPLGAPRGLDHFECYNVPKASELDIRVRLTDPVGTIRTTVVVQWLLCDPAVKVHGSITTTIKHPDAHLACYVLVKKDNSPLLQKTINQFEPKSRKATVRSNTANTLCVPSRSVLD
jgi:hypothetical protein